MTSKALRAAGSLERIARMSSFQLANTFHPPDERNKRLRRYRGAICAVPLCFKMPRHFALFSTVTGAPGAVYALAHGCTSAGSALGGFQPRTAPLCRARNRLLFPLIAKYCHYSGSARFRQPEKAPQRVEFSYLTSFTGRSYYVNRWRVICFEIKRGIGIASQHCARLKSVKGRRFLASLLKRVDSIRLPSQILHNNYK